MKTILLADDDQDVLELIQAKLARSDYRLITARDGNESIQACKEHSPDLVLMDINMPNLNGLEATRTLRSQGFTNPIIILTSSDSEENRREADEAGSNGFILKTSDLNNLKNVINMTLMHFLNF